MRVAHNAGVRLRDTWLALPAALALVALAAGPAGAALRPIDPGKTLVVVGQQDEGAMDDYVAGTGLEPAGVMWYTNLFDEPAALQAQLDRIERHLVAHPQATLQLGVSFGSVSTPEVSRAPVIPLGVLDAQIDQLATWLKQLDTAVFLRLGYEFDLLGGQYGPAPLYAIAYRYVVDRLRARGVGNVAYVWHSAGAFWRVTDYSGAVGAAGTFDRSGTSAPFMAAYAESARGRGFELQPITAFYPGREYVDYFAISYWGDACCGGRSNDQARADYELRTRELLAQARALGLPLMLGESTPVYVGADSGAESVEWLDGMFALVEEFDIRALALIVPDWRAGGFFAQPFWNGYWPDARIHRFAATKARYLAEVARSRYVHGADGPVAMLRGEAVHQATARKRPRRSPRRRAGTARR